MADKAVVVTVSPLLVRLDDGTDCPAMLMATPYTPAFGDVVTTLPLAGGSVVVLGPWS